MYIKKVAGLEPMLNDLTRSWKPNPRLFIC